MMNGSDLVAAIVFGLSVPLALSAALRLVSPGGRILAGRGRAVSAGRLAAAILAGPGLLIDRLVEHWQTGDMPGDELVLGFAAALAWALVYGVVALELFTRALLPA